MVNQWLYERVSDDSSPRFVLGERGRRPLVCFGINPSTAVPEKLDPTLTRVRNLSRELKFDGWIMLNLYPQRATLPAKLHRRMNIQIHNRNVESIRRIFSSHHDLTVWAAWGGIIEKRPFLKQCLADIAAAVPSSAQWVRRGALVGKKHPHHPLYLKNDARFEGFDIINYLRDLSKQ